MSSSNTVDAYLNGPCRPEVFSLACAIAGVPVPITPIDSKSFAERCIAGAKVKAELLQKALPSSDLPHSRALQLVAKGLRFTSWQQMTLFATRVASMPPSEIGNQWNSHFFTAALWRLDDISNTHPLIEAVAASFSDALRDVLSRAQVSSSVPLHACFLVRQNALPPQVPWEWETCLDRSQESDDISDTYTLWKRLPTPFSPSAYRAWLQRDDPDGFSIWDQTLTEDMWRLLADALNHFQAFETRIEYDYGSLLPYRDHTDIVGPALVPWFESLLSALDHMPLALHLTDLNGHLMVCRILDDMEHCDRLCSLLEPLSDPSSSETMRITAHYGRYSQPILQGLRRAYSAMIGMVYAYRNIPWSAIAPFESLPNARSLIAAEDHHLRCQTLYFVRDVGIRIDDNGARADFDHVQPWVDRFFSSPRWGFGYSVQLPVGPFTSHDFVRSYAGYLRKASTCFDPSVPLNLDVIDKLRYGDPYDRSGSQVYADIDAPATHLMLVKRAEYFEAIAATMDQPIPKRTFDFRPRRDPLPLSILDRAPKKRSGPRSCTCGSQHPAKTR